MRIRDKAIKHSTDKKLHIAFAVMGAMLMFTLAFWTTYSPTIASADTDVADSTQSTTDEIAVSTAPNTYITVKYYEHYDHDLDGNPTDAGTRLLGERAFPATAGQTVSIWDYTADIPGFFLFDGWPASLTVSENPDDNVFEIFYFRLSTAQYTVRYHAMVGADLTADTWAGALATNPKFYTLGEQTITGQLYDKLVSGEQYETELDDAYVVGSFPEEIRLSLSPSSNILNILYVPSVSTGPDKVEINEKPEADESFGGFDDDTDFKVDTTVDSDMTDTPGESDGTEGDNGSSDDNGNGNEDEWIDITDEMIENGPNEAQVESMRGAYELGYKDGQTLLATGDDTARSLTVLIAMILISGAVMITYWIANKRNKQRHMK